MKKQIKFRTPVVATDLRSGGRGSDRLVGNNGDINASSRKDLMLQIAKMMEMAASGQEIVTASEYNTRELAAKHAHMITAAFQDRAEHKVLGEVMADELYQAANRDGFARRFLARQELTQGSVPRVKMRMKNMTAIAAGAPVKVQVQLARDNTFYPSEFYINGRPFVEEREIQQSVGDVVEEKYIEGLEALMVTEDRTWKALADATIGMANPLTNVSGTLTPGTLAAVRTRVIGWNIPSAFLLVANDLWQDFVEDPGWQQVIDQVSKHEVLLTGRLGTVFGMEIISDAFRHPQHKVLSAGEFYVVGDPINHGMYTDRGTITSVPIDISHEGIPGRGWAFSELISMVIAGPRSVAKGIRSA